MRRIAFFFPPRTRGYMQEQNKHTTFLAVRCGCMQVDNGVAPIGASPNSTSSFQIARGRKENGTSLCDTRTMSKTLPYWWLFVWLPQSPCNILFPLPCKESCVFSFLSIVAFVESSCIKRCGDEVIYSPSVCAISLPTSTNHSLTLIYIQIKT